LKAGGAMASERRDYPDDDSDSDGIEYISREPPPAMVFEGDNGGGGDDDAYPNDAGSGAYRHATAVRDAIENNRVVMFALQRRSASLIAAVWFAVNVLVQLLSVYLWQVSHVRSPSLIMVCAGALGCAGGWVWRIYVTRVAAVHHLPGASMDGADPGAAAQPGSGRTRTVFVAVLVLLVGLLAIHTGASLNKIDDYLLDSQIIWGVFMLPFALAADFVAYRARRRVGTSTRTVQQMLGPMENEPADESWTTDGNVALGDWRMLALLAVLEVGLVATSIPVGGTYQNAGRITAAAGTLILLAVATAYVLGALLSGHSANRLSKASIMCCVGATMVLASMPFAFTIDGALDTKLGGAGIAAFQLVFSALFVAGYVFAALVAIQRLGVVHAIVVCVASLAVGRTSTLILVGAERNLAWFSVLGCFIVAMALAGYVKRAVDARHERTQTIERV
jgi:hypothetical protein